jgi:uncharacterized protein (DUF2147 family)
VPVLISMRPDGPGRWTGELYNMDDGKTYSGNLIEVGPDAVRMRVASSVCAAARI